MTKASLLAFTTLVFVTVPTYADQSVWEPSYGHKQINLWPGIPPNSKPMPGPEKILPSGGHLIAGKPVTGITNISTPTITVYAPRGKNTGAAVLVLPGGGFAMLAIDFEGTEVCDWLVAKGITCILEKYRVPSEPYEWKTDSRPSNLQIPTQSLTDTQRAMRFIRSHAAELQIDPHKIGVLGFSAGGYLVAQISTNYDKKLYTPVDNADKLSARPDFAIAVYPGHLSTKQGQLNPNVPITSKTPPTFIVQAEDDNADGVHQSLIYFRSLKDANVPAELHLYANGGHAFGLRQTNFPITKWPNLVDDWLITIGMVTR